MREEPWESDQVLHAELHRLLVMILEHGPTPLDTIRRYMLRPHELAAVIPEQEQSDNTSRTIEGLIDYLDGRIDTPILDDATRRWRAAARRTRERFGWDALAPAVVKRATLRAKLLMLHARRHGWLEPHDDQGTWRITERGIHAVDHMWTDGVREPGEGSGMQDP